MSIESKPTGGQGQGADLSKRDQHLSQTLATTLNKSLADLDDISVIKLKRARAQALAYSPQAKRHWLQMSIAASVLVLVAAPLLWRNAGIGSADSVDDESIAQEIPFAAQEMDDMEMLLAMDDIDV